MDSMAPLLQLLLLILVFHAQAQNTWEHVNNLTEAIEPRLVGGIKVRENEYPYFATVASTSSVLCGGFLVHEDMASARVRVRVDSN